MSEKPVELKPMAVMLDYLTLMQSILGWDEPDSWRFAFYTSVRNLVIKTLAKEFAISLAQAIGGVKIRKVAALNAKLGEQDIVCHSHDYCDANMVMAEAWEECFGFEFDTQENHSLMVWNDAWSLAKREKFFV